MHDTSPARPSHRIKGLGWRVSLGLAAALALFGCDGKEILDPGEDCQTGRVSFRGECRPRCTTVEQCASGEACFAAPGGGVCVPAPRVTTVVPTGFYHVSRGPEVTAIGGIHPVGGVSTGTSGTVTPPIE